MNKPWSDIPSIWDGWDKQFRCLSGQTIGVQPRDGGHCAITYIDATLNRDFRRVMRVNAYIAAQFPEWEHDAVYPIVWANNELGWTPEQFRDLDRRLEYEAGMTQAASLVDAIPEPERVEG